ncbi:acyl-CoA dehydrogenase family protein [Nocardioides sp. Bht2]|uniref:acyl-CoA dehydrogenase family protein n=1 Tax=Nocardioides sp. Bht2 TaxID=3392297 RepID=UPI0039B58167
MAIADNADQLALAELTTGLIRRHAPVERTREQFSVLAEGATPRLWQELVEHGLHALHLPEAMGGGGAGLAELAVVGEQCGRGLAPGPWLSTVIASGVLAALDPSHPALSNFVAGATGTLVRGLRVTKVGERWQVSGVSELALGLVGAEILVLETSDDHGDRRWFVVPIDEVVARCIPVEATDLSRSLGRLDADGLELAADRALHAGDRRVDLILTTVLAAEASGVMAWALATGVDHVRTRVQFGRPVGAFQAIQHRMALMLVRAESAAASVWDVARAEAQTVGQQRLAAAHGVLNAVAPSVDQVLDLVTLLGGIGYTWEHDAHLYWRRAMSLAALAGSAEHWALELGHAAEQVQRDFTFLSSETLPALRREVGAVLDQVVALGECAESGGWAQFRPGPAADLLAREGLVAPHFPAPYGRSCDAQEQAVIADEFERRGLRQPNLVFGEWVLPTLLMHGSAEQQERFIVPTLRGQLVWCQLFSEPGAGSDLASLSTRGTKVEGGWTLQGQKVWTSRAHEADWGVCLARTDASAPKHQGISYFLVDLRSAGVEVRPLLQSTGRADFNEVFLDNVFVPDDCLVGEREGGWRLAMTTLGNERLSVGHRLTHGTAARFADLLAAQRPGPVRDETLRAFGRCTAREIAHSAMGLRDVLARAFGLEPGAQSSVSKVFAALLQRDGARDLVVAAGPQAAAAEAGYAMDQLGLPAVLFGGGTVEIQLNLIAQRVLGLPR